MSCRRGVAGALYRSVRAVRSLPPRSALTEVTCRPMAGVERRGHWTSGTPALSASSAPVPHSSAERTRLGSARYHRPRRRYTRQAHQAQGQQVSALLFKLGDKGNHHAHVSTLTMSQSYVNYLHQSSIF